MSNWYGWIIEQSLDDQALFEMMSTVKMKSEEEDWKEHIVEVPEEKVEEIIKFLKDHLKPEGWYAHLIKGNEMVVVYKDKEFKVKEGDDYTPMRAYGLSQGTLEDQLPDQGLFEQAREEGL